MTLRKKTFSAVRWTTASMVIKTVLMICQFSVLARLLSPIEFGVMAVVAAILAFLQIFSDMGVGTAIIHFQDMSEEAASNLFSIGLIIAFALMGLVILFAPFAAKFYATADLSRMLLVISFVLPINAVSQQFRSHAEKRLEFRLLAIIEVISAIGGLTTSVVLAFLGLGVYSLIFGVIFSALCTAYLSWVLLAKAWRPAFTLNFGGMGRYFKFGAYTAAASLVNSMNMQADVLLGGRVLGVGNLGAYTLPKDLSLRIAMAVNPIVTRIGLPVMAQAQGDRNLLKGVFLKSLRMTTSINFPVYLFLSIYSSDVIKILAGDKWAESGRLLMILAIWGLFRSIGNPAGSLVLAVGRGRLLFFWSACQLVVQLPVFFLGAKFGLMGLSVALSICALILPFPQWFFIIRPLCGASFFEYFAQIFFPFVAAAIAGFFSYFLCFLVDFSLFRIILGMMSGLVVYFFASYFLNRSWVGAMMQLIFGRMPRWLESEGK